MIEKGPRKRAFSLSCGTVRPAMTTRQQGTLIQWDAAKGYGFIAPEGGGPKLFVHAKAFGLRPRRPFVGERLSYEAGQDAQGKPRAQAVRSLEPRSPAEPPPAVQRQARRQEALRGSSLWLIPGFALLVLVVHLGFGLPHWLWGGYLAMSLATFIVYAGDKRAARLQQWRVSEATLHALALACGWPGALLAQQLLRHKSAKASFRRLFWLSVMLNVLGFVLIFTPLGSKLLHAYVL
ncbi:uncharacterized membrane protein YsdA (DUF1294 family) [Roseateles asaccharophilus]|uniref:Uncharacterized membrane protein YsdA (DUF1294 family) n=2 Tax=Roseateles asaccharophilus TaxID=582607 RepID=A0A4V3CK31_9BURK|nr:uncharacterized membrane protein YsdA (DUF1294 family) [Roseateles asaccharophilus]